MTAIVGIRVGSRGGFPWMRGRRAHPIEWRGGRGFRRSYKDPDSLPLPLPLPLILILILILAFDVRGPSAAAEPADKTRRAPHMDVRRFPRGQDAPSENPDGSANPMRSIGREGGVCFFAP